MKKQFIFFVAFLLLSQINYSQEKYMNEIKEVLNEIEQKYAPDKRVAVFDIKVVEKNELLYLNGETNLEDAKSALMATLRKKGLKTQDEITMLPSEKLEGKTFGIVNVSVASIRSKPSHPAELATQSLLGTVVNVLKKKGGWYLVQTPDMYISWAENDAVTLADETAKNVWINSDRIIFTKEYGFVYAKADEKSEHVSDIVIGNILKLIEKGENFCKVEFPDGRVGFVKNDECKDFDEWNNSLDPTAEDIIETAKKFRGVPYLWGGTSSKLLDCSGFTKTVFYMNGILLDRDASQQVLKGEVIDISNGYDKLKKGDLVFFGRKGKEGKRERITHVGIYIEDGDFIHEAGMVKINSFNKKKENFSSYRTRTFLHARRILDSVGKNGIQLIKNNHFYYGE